MIRWPLVAVVASRTWQAGGASTRRPRAPTRTLRWALERPPTKRMWPRCPLRDLSGPASGPVRRAGLPGRPEWESRMEEETTEVVAEVGFNGLGLRAELLAALAELGYEEPTPIQRLAIPPMLAGRDVLGQAATGTGKTAAFALPLLQAFAPDAVRDRPYALIVVPTRELAVQVAEAVRRYGRSLGVRVLAIY